MPKFLIEGSYLAEGLRGLAKRKALGRRVAVMDASAAPGRNLEGVYSTRLPFAGEDNL
jgi:hypothetical protein